MLDHQRRSRGWVMEGGPRHWKILPPLENDKSSPVSLGWVPSSRVALWEGKNTNTHLIMKFSLIPTRYRFEVWIPFWILWTGGRFAEFFVEPTISENSTHRCLSPQQSPTPHFMAPWEQHRRKKRASLVRG